MRRFVKFSMLCVFVLHLLMPGLASASSADSQACDAVTVDTTTRSVLDVSAASKSAESLSDLGYDVRIRAFETAPNGNLDAWYKNQLSSCSSWSMDGEFPKGSLVVIAFSMDRESAIYYGPNLKRTLDGEIDQIRAEEMNDNFRSGDFTAGITDTIDAISATIQGDRTESSQVVNVTEEATSGGSAFGWAMAGLVLALVLAAAVYGAYRLHKSLKTRRLALARTRSDVLVLAHGVKERIGKLELKPYETDVALLSSELNEDDLRALRDAFGTYSTTYDRAITAASAISDEPSLTLDKPHPLEGWVTIRDRYGSLDGAVLDAEKEQSKLRSLIDHYNEEIKEAPSLVTRLATRSIELRARQEELRQQGFHVDQSEHFAEIDKQLLIAQREIEAKRPGHALDELRGGEGLLDDIESTLQFAPDQFKALNARYEEGRTELQQGNDALYAAVAVYAGIEERDHQDYLSGLATTTQLNELYSSAQAHLELARDACTMESQQWSESAGAFRAFEASLSDLLTSCESVEQRLDLLNDLETSLPRRHESLRDSATQTLGDINGRKGNQRKFEKQLTQLLDNFVMFDTGTSLLQLRDELERVNTRIQQIDTQSQKEHKRVLDEEEEERRRERRRREAAAEAARRNDNLTSGAIGFGVGSAFGSSGGGSDFGGGSSGSWGGSDGGGSSGSW